MGPQRKKKCVGHVDFMLFVSISFALVSQRKPSNQWNMGFNLRALKLHNLNQLALLSIYYATKDVLYLGMKMDSKTMHIISKKDQTVI